MNKYQILYPIIDDFSLIDELADVWCECEANGCLFLYVSLAMSRWLVQSVSVSHHAAGLGIVALVAGCLIATRTEITLYDFKQCDFYCPEDAQVILRCVTLGSLVKYEERSGDGLTWHAHIHVSRCADHCLMQKYTFSIWVRHVELWGKMSTFDEPGMEASCQPIYYQQNQKPSLSMNILLPTCKVQKKKKNSGN